MEKQHEFGLNNKFTNGAPYYSKGISLTYFTLLIKNLSSVTGTVKTVKKSQL